MALENRDIALSVEMMEFLDRFHSKTTRLESFHCELLSNDCFA